MTEPRTPEDTPAMKQAKAEADAFREADELEVHEVEAVDTAATLEENPE